MTENLLFDWLLAKSRYNTPGDLDLLETVDLLHFSLDTRAHSDAVYAWKKGVQARHGPECHVHAVCKPPDLRHIPAHRPLSAQKTSSQPPQEQHDF